MKAPAWSTVLPFAIVLVYFLLGLLGHYLNMTYIHGR
jgi:hypothetical protein